MANQEDQTLLPAQEAREAMSVQSDQQDKNVLTPQQSKQALLDQLDAQRNATEELRDEELTAISGGAIIWNGETIDSIRRVKSGSSLIDLTKESPEDPLTPPLRRAWSGSERELQILRQQSQTPHFVTPPSSGGSSPGGPLESPANKRPRLG